MGFIGGGRRTGWLTAAGCALALSLAGCSEGRSGEAGPQTPGATSTRSEGYVPKIPANAYSVREVAIPMRDGTILKASEYVAEGVGRVPTVIFFYPYGRQLNLAGGTDAYLATHGYNELVVDVRGTGASGGEWHLWTEDEKLDFAEVIRWAAARPHSDGSVVLSGASYAAVSALHAAEQEGVEAVKALFIRVPMADAYRDVASSGGSPDTGFLFWWSTAFIGAPTVVQPLVNPQPNPQTSIDHLANIFGVLVPTATSLLTGSFDGAVPPLLSAQNFGSYDGDYYYGKSPLRRIDRIKVPTFILGANYDIFARTQPLLYKALDLPLSQKKMVMVPDYHIFDPKWLSSDDGSRLVLDNRGGVIPSENNLALAWFDRWAKGRKNGIEEYPPLTHYFAGNPVAATFAEEAPSREADTFHINASALGGLPGPLGAGTLTPSPASVAGSISMPFQPITGVCSRTPIQYLAGVAPDFLCSTDNRINEIDGFNFDSEPVTQTTRYYGPGNLRLFIRSNRPDAQIVAFLSAVSENGTSTEVSFGHLVASHRALTAKPCASEVVLDCSVYLDGELLQPWHPYTLDAQEPLTAGEVYEVQIEMMPTFVELKRGERLRLTLKTGDFPHVTPTLSVLLDSLGGVTTVLSGPEFPSALTLGKLR